MKFKPLTEKEEQIGKLIVNAAFKVHQELGPGLLEKVYEVCLAHEFKKCGLSYKRQVDIPISYDGIILKKDYDLIYLWKI
jgi:GxxExxY protein